MVSWKKRVNSVGKKDLETGEGRAMESRKGLGKKR